MFAEFINQYSDQLVFVVRMILAAACGAAIGWERELAHKGAGFRTHILICMGACLFVVVGVYVQRDDPEADPLRIVQGLLLSIGFLSGGVIFNEGGSTRGITTAAGLWALTAIGMAVGFGYYFIAAVSTFMVFIVLTLFMPIKQRSHNAKHPFPQDPEEE
jgi:putative Mg2+ transporter-C (MgtC) family protein